MTNELTRFGKSTMPLSQTVRYALENPNSKVYIVASSGMERTLSTLIDFLRQNKISYRDNKRFEFRLDNASTIRIVKTSRGISSNSIIGEY